MTTVFFDRTSGKRLPQALQLLGLSVEWHGDHFAHDTPDEVWLAEVGQRGWFVITNDKRIRFNESERNALISHGVGCFVLSGGSLNRFAQARILFRVWDRMQELMDTLPRPFIVSIHSDGHVVRIYPPS